MSPRALRARWVWTLSLAGTLPMLLAVGLIPHASGVRLLSYYSLAILAFLAGTSWMVALMNPSTAWSQRKLLLVSTNVCVIAAVSAAIWLAPAQRFSVFAFLFALLLVQERSKSAFAPQPPYYRAMRLTVTCIVVAIHVAAALRLNLG